VRALLDTHALLWWLDGDRRLSQRARRLIGSDETTVLVSAASAWEICTKFRLGKLPGATAVATDVAGCLGGQGFAQLPITIDHAQRAGSLPGPHRDPFDRMLIAQSQAEDLPLVTIDPVFRQYGIKIIW
jgi:PIN domain nuclease of toxin-antitoxin system